MCLHCEDLSGLETIWTASAFYLSWRGTPHTSTGHHCTTWGKVSVLPKDCRLITMNSKVQSGFWRQVQWRLPANIRCDLKLLRPVQRTKHNFYSQSSKPTENPAVKGTVKQTQEMHEDMVFLGWRSWALPPPSFCVIHKLVQLPLVSITTSKKRCVPCAPFPENNHS